MVVGGDHVPDRARRTCARKPGRAWAAIRQSEPAALAAGINTTLYKLWAFALASFVTGVAGGVLAGAVRYLYSIDFQTQDSITLLAVVLMGGAYSIWGAIVAGLLLQLLPAILNDVGVSPDWLVDPVRHRRAPGAHHRPDAASSTSCPGTSPGWSGSSAASSRRSAADQGSAP